MATTTLQVRVDEDLKRAADELFASLGLDTTTAVRIFLSASVEQQGIPFEVSHRRKAAPSGYEYALVTLGQPRGGNGDEGR